MERTLNTKVVVVTGGAEGIGYEIASSFLEQNAKSIIILDLNEEKGSSAAISLCSKYGNGKALYIKCDITKDLDLVSGKIFETYGRVDVLVNNAGAVNEGSVRKTLELNSIALIEWSMKFWEHMRTDKRGHGGTIINIGSIYSFTIDPYLVFYKASKFAVQGFTQSLGHEDNYKKFGVRLVIVCPGYTYSSLTGKTLCWEEHSKDFEEFVKTQKWQTCNEVAKATVTVFQIGDSGSSWLIVGGELTRGNTAKCLS